MTNRAKPKVFCIGFQKTGTSSMRDALAPLGFKVAGHYGTDMDLDELRSCYVERGLKLAQDYDVVQDMPWPLIYKELDAAFPGAKFIFTVRDTENWYQSMVKHFGEKPSSVRQLAYGEDCPCPVGHEDQYKKVYEAYSDEVREYFSGRPDDFAIFDLEKGDGWEKLTEFLGLEGAPSGPFVHSNKAEMRSSFSYRFRWTINWIKYVFGKVFGLSTPGN